MKVRFMITADIPNDSSQEIKLNIITEIRERLDRLCRDMRFDRGMDMLKYSKVHLIEEE